MQLYQHQQPFYLSSGYCLPQLTLGYTILGDVESARPVVWVFHALTANSNPELWWKGLVGTGTFFDPSNYTIICVNIPGSCYGSSGPLSENPETNEPYYHSFPVFSTTDIIRSFQLIRKAVNITSIAIGIGGSMGAQHLLQWAAMEPGLFENIITIASNSKQSAYGLAIDTAQRLAIEADCTWKNHAGNAGMEGMKAARAMALVLYRTYQSFAEKNTGTKGDAESYQRYQATKIAERFNAFSYYNLSLSRNTHDVEKDLELITAKTLVIGFTSDALFPVAEQKHLASRIKNAQLKIAESIYGHDAFLVETDILTSLIKTFLNENHDGRI